MTTGKSKATDGALDAGKILQELANDRRILIMGSDPRGAIADAVCAHLSALPQVEPEERENEPIGWAYRDKRWDKCRWHLCASDGKPRPHEGREIQAVYLESELLSLRRKVEETEAERGWKPTHRHKKRGSRYKLESYGEIQTDVPLTDYAKVAIYSAEDGCVWVRSVSEFEDGRFETLPARALAGEQP